MSRKSLVRKKRLNSTTIRENSGKEKKTGKKVVECFHLQLTLSCERVTAAPEESKVKHSKIKMLITVPFLSGYLKIVPCYT